MKNIIKLNLMEKLISYFLVLIIIPVIVLGFFSYNSAKRSLEAEAKGKIRIILDSAAKELDMKTSQIKEQVNLIGNLSQISDYVVGVKNNKLDANMANNTKKILIDYQKAQSNISEDIFIADTNGNIILDSSNSKGMNIADRDYFKQSISGNANFSDVVISKLSKKPEINYSYPIKDEKGAVIGIIGAGIKFDAITNILAGVKSGESGYAFMISKDGLVLYHPQADKILKENMIDTSKDNKELNNIIKSMIEKNESDGVYTYAEMKKYVAYKPVGNWSVAINIPVNEYMVGAVSIKNRTVLIAIIAIIIGAVVAIVVSKKITTPIKNLMQLMAKAKDGDLTVRSEIKLEDEIGQLSNSFNSMLEAQQNAITQVLNTAKDVESSSRIVGDSASEMAAAAENQSSSSEELTATMNEMSSSIVEVSESITSISQNVSNISYSIGEMSKASVEMSKKVEETAATVGEVTKSLQDMDVSIELVANNSNSANKEALKTEGLAKEGRITIDNTIKEMDNVISVVSNLTEVIKGLGTAAVQIGDIIEVIDDIAEQTNLLSLNASIEAARAGEHGKGFAVVAGAIGSLAEKSGEATKDITKLVKHIQEEVQYTITTTENGANQVKNGVDLVKDTGNSLDEIFEAIKKTADSINEIAKITLEQSKFSKSIMNSIEKVNEVSMQSSALVEEQSASVGEMVVEIERINNLTQQVASAAEEQSASSEEVLATSENVSNSASEVATGAEELATTAESMASKANMLIDTVSIFKIK
ncbi:methyl-accepting chemotaxis protein [Clostridium tetanomorphum]|uniref:HAMP domain-containing protein n=1 Tax=Clostridium tetanomorphum TaxID=1553 RepID=A0A923J1Y2_CLOTT|nr:methyl-accepting chemotaxis protein [Clostridium tetanomorphum]KAJ52348.1 methyl-accepting chemotaxis protein [Clostridium tetanomorphum DSM 665]MBC2397868.1 HAMP domain-containing protein [Clostridium tetanomorphum]MBP1864817.1 methyl-accepting chemotaxis protein [Clostridium tetanomorphum]NRS83993.1 methyl-accepting chemotaxis protein [Clostridium tetanomorphum]NRZ97211.1 methyl-accepting chemotaxis protein [Clostridium tetanomorphum]